MARNPPARQRSNDRTRFCQTFRRLTGLATRSTAPNALPESLLDRAVPAPRDLLDRHAPVLRTLTVNVLRRHTAGIVEKGAWTYRRLLAIRGFGVVCLLDVLSALSGTAGRTEPDVLAIRDDCGESRGPEDCCGRLVYPNASSALKR